MLAVIPAKGASTRLPRKNMLYLGGKPLLAWTVEAAIESKVFDEIVVSSEDEEVLELAKKMSTTPHRRPYQLAVDPAGCIHVAQFVQAELEQVGKHFDYIAILMPTCPFRSSADIKKSVEIALGKCDGSIISVSEFSHTPFNAFQISGDGQLSPTNPEFFGKKSQELPVAYRPNGAIFIMKAEVLRRAKSLFEPPMSAYVMPQSRSVDIDNQLDMEWATFLLNKLC